jgi:hypothetical protein
MTNSGNDGSLSEADRRERIRRQIRIIQDALGDNNVGWDTGDTGDTGTDLAAPDSADFRYLYHQGRILVRTDSLQSVQDIYPGGSVIEQAQGLPVVLFRLPDQTDVMEAVSHLDAQLGEGVATPDHILYVTAGPDPVAKGCCPATEPDVPSTLEPLPPVASDTRCDGRGVRVSVVDTGWYEPAARQEQLYWLKDVTGDPEIIDPNDIHPYAGHGTFVAGIVKCIAPEAEVHVEGFLPRAGAVLEWNLVVQLFEALYREPPPHVISVSAGTKSRKNLPLLAFQAFWESGIYRDIDTILVAAAGNDAASEEFWPAAFDWAVSVGAVDSNGRRATFSNFGDWVDVYAPGVGLVNAFPSGTYRCKEPPNVGQERRFNDWMATWSGTSFSTPVVTGMIAARMSCTGETARQAADALLTYARTHAQEDGPPWLPGPDNNAWRNRDFTG